MAHRIRYALGQEEFTRRMKGTVEADETYTGGRSRRIGQQSGWENKTPVVALVQWNGKVRSSVVPTVSAKTLKDVLLENVHPSSLLITDELTACGKIGKNLSSHSTSQSRGV